MLFTRALQSARIPTSQYPISQSFRRQLSSSRSLLRQTDAAQPSVHGAYYKTHGRALFKSLTMAFFSYQVFYWIWLTLEAEVYKDEKSSTIHSLEGEVRLLSSGQGTHVLDGKKRLLDEEAGR